MNIAMDTGGVNTARPRDDLTNNNADNDHVCVIAISGGGDIHDHAHDDELMLTDMSAATNSRQSCFKY